MKTNTKSIVMVFAAAGMAVSATASAADRTVCFELKIKTDGLRWDCPDASTPGARRPCRPAGTDYDWAVGFAYKVWDKDSGNGENDDLIGTWHTGGTGERCVTFAWEGASYQEGENNPDVYIEITNRVTATFATDHSKTIDIIDKDSVDYSKVSWRNGDSSDPDAFVAMNCKAQSTCRILPGSFLVPTNDTASDYGKALMVVDSAQRVIELFHSKMNASNVDIKYPAPECPTGCAVSRTLAKIPKVRFDEGVRVAHEMGHVLQMQLFEQDTLTSNDCTRGGGSNDWSMNSVEFYGCATTEGFASYIAGVTWWRPENTGSIPIYHGIDFESATLLGSTCNESARVPGQVAKAFWDLDDANNEAGVGLASGDDDVTNIGTLSIVAGWDVFADGSGNRQDREAGADSGVNARDYDWNNNVNDQTFFDHNCIGAQTN